MRHTSLLGQPNPVYLLPPGVVFPAPLRLLIPAAGLPHRLFSCLTTAGIRAVPLPTIAVRAHHHLASASVAAQQSSVARGPAASPTDRRATCESGSKALYSSGGARPPWRQRAWFPTPYLGPLPVFFSATDYRSVRFRTLLLQIKQPIMTTQRQLLLCITQRSLPSSTRPIDSILDLD